MRQRIENAIHEAVESRRRAGECTNAQLRDEWLKTAAMWDAIARQYETLLELPRPILSTKET